MDYKLETRCIHSQENKNQPFGAVSVPIYQTAIFSHPGIGESSGYDYSRESNPTRASLENIISQLEGAQDTVACSSGMAAISICLSLFQAGDHIICSEDLYGGSVRMFRQYEERGLRFSYTNTSELENIKRLLTPETKAFYIETPSNPTMQITDLFALKQLADEHGILIIVDNTFLSPYFQTPIQLGADLVIHSGTKFLNGHNDVIAGFLCSKDQNLAKKIRFLYKTVGSCLSPFDSYLMIRGIKTLAIRQERQQENAIQIAKWLQSRKEIVKVYYPGLKEHPGYEVNQRQARGSGSMISFQVDSKETVEKILQKVELITYAESLGGVETLITYPMIQTHGDVPKEMRERLGINERFLRMSVGIENIEDLIEDLEQALE
ncbi:MAG TPA: cystathionine gamma-synthase [Lachnospiraceae bacterium]|nr:cystathionine gamma-synthase [Lachnospiraceae bacterium]HIS61436.1 PLP-dependent transferase [Candidatus Scybalomonas excrementigallinarum]